jgi:DNA-directed RNA polymerase specialized sigma24 family protein
MDDKRLLQTYVRLTPRQREVLQLVCTGLSNQEIGTRLYIAPSVVAGHLTNIYDTLAGLEEMDTPRPNRYTAIRLYVGFFDRNPELTHFQ